MTAYNLLLVIAVTTVAQGLLGYVILKRKVDRRIYWLFPCFSVGISHFLSDGQLPFLRMLVLVIPLLHSMKIVVSKYQQIALPLNRWLIFYFLTVGMNPKTFLRKSKSQMDYSLLGRSVLNGLIGIFLISAALYLHIYWQEPNHLQFWIKSMIVLCGISLLFHFGILNLNVLFIQRLGFYDYPIFKEPFKSKSLTEFWGKRWNLAFSEMTKSCIFIPLSKKMPGQVAYIVAFLFSGVLHEIAISLTVLKGYGLPMLFFVLSAVGIQLERSFNGKQPGIAWVLLFLIAPFPLLFHGQFIQEVVWLTFDILLKS